MDIFEYIEWNRQHGFTLLDPWNVHLEAGYKDDAFLDAVKHAAARVGLPFGCVAVDGAHIYEPTAEARAENRAWAYRWIDICRYLGARQVRIDAGGPDEMPDDVFAVIVDGYADVLEYAGKRGVEVIVENHWGPTKHPKNVVKLLDTVKGLGLLFDTNNWAPGVREQAWEMCAKYAKLSHIKTFQFDDAGNDPSVDISRAMHSAARDGIYRRMGDRERARGRRRGHGRIEDAATDPACAGRRGRRGLTNRGDMRFRAQREMTGCAWSGRYASIH